MPGRRLLVAVVGVEVDGQRHVRVLLRRVRNVLRHQRPQVIEVEVVPAAAGVLVEQSGDDDGVVSGREPPTRSSRSPWCRRTRTRYRSMGDSAVGTPSTVDCDLAAVRVEERAEVEVVLLRGRVADRDRADVRRCRWARCAWRGPCSTTARASRPRRTCSPPKSRCTCSALSDSSMRSESPPTFRLASPVTAMFEMVAPHSTSDWKPEIGRELLHPGASRPGARRRGLVPALNAGSLVAPPATSSTRSSLAASPMKYRPPVSPAPLSTLHVGVARSHVGGEEAPVLRVPPPTISKRGAKTMYIFRQSRVRERDGRACR